MLRSDDFSAYLRILFDVAALFTVLDELENKKQMRHSEYYALLLAAVLGCTLAGDEHEFRHGFYFP